MKTHLKSNFFLMLNFITPVFLIRNKIFMLLSLLLFFSAVQLPAAYANDYRVILGSFENRSNALSWQSTLNNLNVETTIEKAVIKSKTFWRVALCLSYADRRSAESALNRIKRQLSSHGYRTCDFWIRTPEVRYRYYHTPHYLEFDSYYH